MTISLVTGRPQELILIRHATTDMAGTFCGQSDPPLNAMGTEQASALALRLRDSNVRRLYASDLRRALQTAEPLSELWDIPIAPLSGLREISFGDWEGRSWSQIRADKPDIRAMESAPELGAPGGEIFASFRCRVLGALKRIAVESNGEVTAVVTHLGVMRIILTELGSANCAWEPHQRIEPCSVHRSRIDSAFFDRVLKPKED